MNFQPATPTIVPPTPSPNHNRVNGSGSSSTRGQSSVSSGSDIFYDAEDSELQTRRRSMYRATGTASSPDLATLLRKAKLRESAAATAKDANRSSRTAQQPLTPNRLRPDDPSHRPTTADTFASPSSPRTPLLKGKSRATGSPAAINGERSPDWVLTSPRSMSNMKEGIKSGKSSMRQKASAFLNMLGSNRERSKTITAANPGYSPSKSFEPTPPPVPPLPEKMKRHISVISQDSDVFISPSGSSDLQKPLPAISNEDLGPETIDVEESMVMVRPQSRNQSRSPSPTATVTHDTVKPKMANRRNRRSMSVSDAELKKVMAASSFTPLRSSIEEKQSEESVGWSSALSGFMSDIEGKLDHIDPISASLDLRDPSTPPRRPPERSKSDTAANVLKLGQPQRPAAKTAHSLPATVGQSSTPAVTLQPVSGGEESLLQAVLSSPSESSFSPAETSAPIRSPSVPSTPIRSRPGSASVPPRVSGVRYGPRSPSGTQSISGNFPSPSRETNRLRIQHRSTASSSEPSLIPLRDDGRIHPLGAASSQDLTTNDLALSRISSSHSPARNTEESTDINSRGRELAAKCWAEDEEFLAKDKIAEWLGGQSPINRVALRHYMENFDFSSLRLDFAFRRLCAKLFLKAETQQVDRILDEFAKRYWDCNPTSIFGTASVVHAVSYSILLLNTDLHVAELSTRMSRGQFVRNTLTAIQMQLQPSSYRGSTIDVSPDDWSSVRNGSDISDPVPTAVRRIKRSDSMTSWSSVTRDGLGSVLMQASSGQLSSTPSDTPAQTSGRQTPINSSRVSVISSGQESKATDSSPFVHDRKWESEMEDMLKEIYTAVKTSQILQPLNSATGGRLSTSSLAPNGTILRQRSLRNQSDRLATFKRGSIRGLSSILSAQGGHSPYGNNGNFDGRASPAPSFATSHEGLHGSSVSFLTPTLGFASNLSHTIIREAQEDDNHSVKSDQSLSTDISISDEELALLGPPWAKEGMLCRKQYWESTGKRAKSRAWMDVFVVIQKGELSMFIFGDHGGGGGGIVGGGNWLENAQPVGSVQLAHSLAHSLPPPGYNRQRPHCMVLTLSTGAVYFFQAGTEELVNEWVSTCNYWAARQSKEPLAGGVSNMEYGWNRVLDPVTRARSISEDNYSRDDDGASVRSGRSRLNKSSTVRADKSPWNDRVMINDWKPPMPPSVSSLHDEETQLDALRKHVTSMKNELEEHNELRTPMTKLYAPRSANAAKASANWEKKSQYLLTEIVKYESYIDSLQAAMTLRLKKRGEKALERALVGASPEDEPVGKGKWKGPEGETIEEDEEPPPTAGLGSSIDSRHFHRRETAEVDGSDDESDDDDT